MVFVMDFLYLGRISRYLSLAGSVFVFSMCMYMPFTFVHAAPGVVQQIHYQGILRDSSSTVVSDGNYDMVFRIYDAASGGTTLWTGTYTAANGNAVSVTNGVFNVLFGSGTGNSLSGIDFNQDALWLGVTIGSDGEMTPRQRMGAVVQALNADRLDGVGLATSSLSTGDILYFDGTDLARLAIGSDGQVLKLSGGLPSWAADTTDGGFFASSSASVVHLADTSDVLVLGGTATTTAGYVFEVIGSALLDDVQFVNATSSGALSIGGALGIGSEAFTDLTGEGLINTGGSLAVATSTLTVATSTYALKSGTSSVALALNGFNQSDYLTVSAWSATTTDALAEGISNVYWTQGRFDTALLATSSLPHLSVGTSSVALTLNGFDQSDYLTLSAWNATTTDALAEGSGNLYWTNTRFDERLSATTTLPNLAVLEGVTNLVAENATTTNATSTNLFASVARFTSSIIDNFTTTNLIATNATTTNGYITSLTAGNATSTNLAVSGATTLANTTNSGTLTVQGLSTLGSASTTNVSISGTLNTALSANSVPFIGTAGRLSEDGGNFVWDNANNRLGIGTTSPSASLAVAGVGLFTGSVISQGALLGTSFQNGTLRLGATAAGEIDTTSGNLTLDSAGGTVLVDDELSVAATTTLAGVLNLSSNRILGVGTPTLATDAANKEYVDSFAQGLVWQEPVLTIGSTTPPGSPTTGDRHIVAGSSATGAWVGEEHNIAEWNGSAWEFASSTTGFSAFVSGAGRQYTYNNTEWVELGSGTSHASLSGLQGGNGSDQFYHLNLTDWNALTDVNAQLTALHTDGSPTFAGLTVARATTTNATSTNLYAGTLTLGNALSVANGGTGTTTAQTGGLFFYDGATFTQDAPNLFWNNATKQLGIGTSTPQGGLHIESDSAFVARFTRSPSGADRTAFFDIENGNATTSVWRLASAGTGNGLGMNDGQFYIESLGATEAAKFVIERDGDIGIGDTTPDGKVEIRQTGTGDILNLYDGATNVFTVLDGGTVGIGTTSPSQRLSVAGVGEQNIVVHSTDSSAVGTYLTNSVSSWRMYNAGGNGGLRFNNGSDRLSIFSTGNVSIGSQNAGSRLAVAGNATIGVNYDTAFAPTDGLLVEGNVGIGTTTPSAKLTVVGDTYLSGNVTATGTITFTGITDGLLVTDTTGGVSASSTISATLVEDAFIRNTGDTISGNLSFSGSAANVALGSNFISGDGDDEGIFIDSVGRVSIGTGTSPTDLLSVRSESGQGITIDSVATSRTAQLHMSRGSGNDTYFGPTENNQLHVWTTENIPIAFGQNNTERLRISEAGNIGIGTTTTAAQLTVQTDGTDDILNLFETGGAEVFTVLESGSVGVRVDDPIATFQVGELDTTDGSAIAISGEGSGTEGGELQLYFSADHDTSSEYLWLDAFENDFRIGMSGAVGTVFTASGEGDVQIHDQGDLRFGDADTSHYVGFQASSTVSANVVWTLPAADGGGGQVLATDGSGALSWSDVALGTSTTGNYVATVADAGAGNITVVGSGSENAAVTLDITDDSLDFTELSNTLTVDESTTVTLGGTNSLTFNLTGTGDFAVQDNGQAALFVSDDGGGVGIGTNAPAQRLHVSGSGNERILIESTSNSSVELNLQNASSTWAIYNAAGGNGLRFFQGGDRVTFANDGDVGIGAGSPDGKLEVRQTGTDDIFNLYDNTTNVFTVLDGGNVGIGVANPTAKLQIGTHDTSDGGAISISGQGAGSGEGGELQLYFAADHDAEAVSGEFSYIDAFQNDVRFGNVGSAGEIMRLTGEGNVGIGTTTPSGNVVINGTTGKNFFQIASSTNQNIFVVDERGNIGIGKTTPDNALVHIAAPANTNTDARFILQSGGEGVDSHLVLSTGFAGENHHKTAIVAEGLGSWNKADLHFVLNNADSTADYTLGTDTKMIITNTGNVGIGTTSPNNLLTVNGAITLASSTPSATSHALYNQGGTLYWSGSALKGVGNGTQGQTIVYDASGDAVATSTLFIASNTNVGIGTTNPGAKLEVEFSGTGGILIDGDNTGDARLEIENGGGNSHVIFDDQSQSNALVIESSAGNDLILNTNGSNERLRITGAGNVGIGTTTPNAPFFVQRNGADGLISRFVDSNYNGLEIDGWSNGANIDPVQANDSFYFGRDVALSNFVVLSGNVGIGDETPDANVEISLNGVTTGDAFHISSNDNANGDIFIVERSGDVGIGIDDPEDKLHLEVSGSGESYLLFTNNTTSDRSEEGFRVGIDANENAVLARGTGVNDLLFQSRGVTQMVLLNNGNVGIGTTAPDALLHVATSTASAVLRLSSGGNQIAGIQIDANSQGAAWAVVQDASTDSFRIVEDNPVGTFSASRFVIASSTGNVGIGTESPSERLHVFGSGDERIRIHTSANTRAGIDIANASSTWQVYNAGGDGGLRFSDGSDRLIIFSDGNVGIGGQSADGTLHVTAGSAGAVTAHPNADDLVVENAGLGGLSVLTPDANDANLFFGSPSDDIGSFVKWNYDANLMTLGTDRVGGDLMFVTNSQVEAMRILDSGFVGIGTSSPTASLHIVGGGHPSSFVHIDTDALGQDAGIRFMEDGLTRGHLYHDATNDRLHFSYEGTTNLNLLSNGIVSIGAFGTNSVVDGPGDLIVYDELEVRGGFYQPSFIAYNGNTACWQGASSGYLGICSSAEKYKDGIIDIPYGLEAVLQVEPVQFVWNELSGNPGKQDVGLIADEVALIIPELGQYGEDGEIESVNYRHYTAVLTKAIQEQHGMVLTLASTTADTDEDTFLGQVFVRFRMWFADTANGIAKFVAGEVHAGTVRADEICVGDICVTEEEFRALVAQANTPVHESTGTPSDADITPPVITIRGNAEAEISVGDTYGDPGATAFDDIDGERSIVTMLDGVETNAVVIDTSQPGTYVITYTATDQAGNIGSASRTVVVSDPQSASTDDTQEEQADIAQEEVVETKEIPDEVSTSKPSEIDVSESSDEYTSIESNSEAPPTDDASVGTADETELEEKPGDDAPSSDNEEDTSSLSVTDE